MGFNPKELTTINAAVNEGVNSKIREQAEKDLRKEIADRLKDELGLAPADFNQLVRERYDSSVSEKITKMEEIVDLNESLVNANPNQLNS
jgi:hypothetical protein